MDLTQQRAHLSMSAPVPVIVERSVVGVAQALTCSDERYATTLTDAPQLSVGEIGLDRLTVLRVGGKAFQRGTAHGSRRWNAYDHELRTCLTADVVSPADQEPAG
jgi:hypothetical protein